MGDAFRNLIFFKEEGGERGTWCPKKRPSRREQPKEEAGGAGIVLNHTAERNVKEIGGNNIY